VIRRWILPLAAILLTLFLMVYHFSAGDRIAGRDIPEELVGVALHNPRPLEPFTLRDHTGTEVTLERLRGKWSFVFFGYTHCPDICPTSLGLLNDLFVALEKRAPVLHARTQGLFISVDPQRDTLEGLKNYVAFFNEGFVGATGSPEQVLEAAKRFGAFFRINKERETDVDYEVVHAASLFLVGPGVALEAVFDPRMFSSNGEKMAERFIRLAQLVEK
jgi:protein SCO1/2